MKCTCSMQDLMSSGCKCGAMDKERNKNHRPEPKLIPPLGLVGSVKGKEWWQNGQCSKPPFNKNLPDWFTKDESMEEWDGGLLEDYIDELHDDDWDDDDWDKCMKLLGNTKIWPHNDDWDGFSQILKELVKGQL